MKIVALGDSITYGFPYTPVQSWVNLASRELEIPIINQGINGDTTTGMLRRFNRDVVSLSPVYVIIMGGTNDAFTKVDAERVYDNIRHMAEHAIHSRITPLIGLPIPCNYPGDEYILGLYREDMREYAMANSIEIIDFHADYIIIESRQKLYDDAIHPNEEGYRIMANTCINTFMPKIKVKK